MKGNNMCKKGKGIDTVGTGYSSVPNSGASPLGELGGTKNLASGSTSKTSQIADRASTSDGMDDQRRQTQRYSLPMMHFTGHHPANSMVGGLNHTPQQGGLGRDIQSAVSRQKASGSVYSAFSASGNIENIGDVSSRQTIQPKKRALMEDNSHHTIEERLPLPPSHQGDLRPDSSNRGAIDPNNVSARMRALQQHRNELEAMTPHSPSIAIGPKHQMYQDLQNPPFVMPTLPSTYSMLRTRSHVRNHNDIMIPGNHQQQVLGTGVTHSSALTPGYLSSSTSTQGTWQDLLSSSVGAPYATSVNPRPHTTNNSVGSYPQNQRELMLNHATRQDQLTAMLLSRDEQRSQRLGITTPLMIQHSTTRNSNILDPTQRLQTRLPGGPSMLDSMGYPDQNMRPTQRQRLDSVQQMSIPYQHHEFQSNAGALMIPGASHLHHPTAHFDYAGSATNQHYLGQNPVSSKTTSKPRVFKSFQERLEDLMEFKERHGHCNVPRRYGPDKSLGVWCNNIRYSYRQLQEGKHPHNTISKEDIKRLDEIGFQWKLKSKDSSTSNNTGTTIPSPEKGNAVQDVAGPLPTTESLPSSHKEV